MDLSMKRVYVFGFTMAVILLFGNVSCTGGLSDSSLEVKSGDFSSLTAFTENGLQTKTGLVDNGTGGRSVVWRPGDAISVFFNNGYGGGAKYTTASNGPKAIFTGDFKGTRGDAWYWGVYPYDSNVSCNGTSVSTQLLSAQVAYSGDVADDLLVTVGRSKDQSFYFKNTCAVIGFTLSQEGISKITFKGNDDEPVSGGFAASFDTNEEIVIIPNEDASKTVEITPGEGLEFETGSQYYFAIFPGEYNSGYTLSFERNDGTVASYSRTTPFTFARSMFYTMTNKDEGLTFSPANPEVEYNFLEVFYGEANCKIAYNVSSTTIDVTPYLTGENYLRTSTFAYPISSQIPAKAYLIWRENELSLNVSELVSNNKITVSNISGVGNALVGVYNNQNEILWSYHLWVPGFDPETVENSVIWGNGIGMRSALGATTAWPDTDMPTELDYSKSGLLFQWGRKDPLGRLSSETELHSMIAGSAPGASSPTTASYVLRSTAIEQIATDENHGITSDEIKVLRFSFNRPSVFISSIYTDSDHTPLWGATYNTDYGKTIFDPSPKGWRVMDAVGLISNNATHHFRSFYSYTVNPFDIWYYFGYRSSVNQGRISNGSGGEYWSRQYYNLNSKSYGRTLGTSSPKIRPNYQVKANAYMIRCVAE